MTASIFHTLREGRTVAKHPTLGVLVSDLGEVLTKFKGWYFGYKDSKLYMRVKICNKAYKVHRIEAEAFLPNPENKNTVDHRNRDRSDNRLVNLQWATQKEQVENSSTVLDRTDYGVRACEDRKTYMKVYDSVRYNNPDKLRKRYDKHNEYMRKKRDDGYALRKCPDGKRHWVFVGAPEHTKAA